MVKNLTPNADGSRVPATARFALAAACCGVFVVTVVIFARMTSVVPLAVLRSVSLMFLGVFVNFAVCLGIVLYVSRRLRKPAAEAQDVK